MPAALVADFDNRSKALDAVQRLVQAGIPREHIDTYPSLENRMPEMPSAGEKVQGAETEMSSNGPLGHLQSLLAKLFGVETSKPQTQGGSEPTSEPFSHESVYMAIGIEGLSISADTVRGLLTGAGAIRIDDHAA
ncbi:MAG: hypothetical protein ACRYHA_25095 [Janthinobacterium lividum]